MFVNALRFVAVAVHLFRLKDYRQLSSAIESHIFQTKIIGQLNYIITIIIITTLLESQIILAEHECCTNWGDCKSNKSNQFKSNQMLIKRLIHLYF